MRKSICFFIGPFGSGGGERNCCNLANAFVKQGIQVTVVAIGLKDHLFLKRFDSRVEFVDLGKKHLRHALIPMMKFLRAKQPQHVLAFNHYMGTALELIRIMPGFNFTLHMRNIVGLTKKYQMNPSFWQSVISKAFVKLLLKNLDGIVSQCHDMEADLVTNWSVSPIRSKVIFNPVAEEVEKNLKPWSLEGKEDEILFVGRLSKEKGIDFLIRSLKELLPRHPGLRVRLLGEGPIEKELKDLSASLGISDKVIFQGFVADPIPYYLKAKVTALPSFSEGFPNVLIESITLGTPIVAFDCETGPSEIVREDFNGYLVELGHQEKFTIALDRALLKTWNFKIEDYRSGPIIREYLDFLNFASHS